MATQRQRCAALVAEIAATINDPFATEETYSNILTRCGAELAYVAHIPYPFEVEQVQDNNEEEGN